MEQAPRSGEGLRKMIGALAQIGQTTSLAVWSLSHVLPINVTRHGRVCNTEPYNMITTAIIAFLHHGNFITSFT